MSKVCAADQVTVKDPVKGVVQCLKCRKCPKGKGSSVQCGDVVPPEKPLMCQDCVRGETFSSTDGTGTCDYCYSCPDHNELTVKNCTLTENSVCGGCKPNFYRDGLTSQCERCSPCCGDGSDIKEVECEAQGMSENQMCNVARADKCRKTPAPTPIPTPAPTPTPVKTSTAKLTTPSVNVSFSPVRTIGFGSERPMSSSSDSWDMTQTEQVYVATGSVLLFFVLAVMLYLLKRKWHPSCPRRTPPPIMEERVPERETLVPFVSKAVDEGSSQEEEERTCNVPTQDTEGPGKLFQDGPPCDVTVAGPNVVLNRVEANVRMGKMDDMDSGGRFLDGDIMERYPALSRNKESAMIGEASFSPKETHV